MGDDRDEDTGQFTERYPREAFIQAFTDAEWMATEDVAETVGCSRRLALDRLKALEEEGVLVGQSVGPGTIWHLSNTEE